MDNKLINNQNCTFKYYQASAYRQKLQLIDYCPFPNNGTASCNKEGRLNLLPSKMLGFFLVKITREKIRDPDIASFMNTQTFLAV